MNPGKRAFDLAGALVLAGLLAVPFALFLAYLAVSEGRPLFYVSERMRAPGQGFDLYKLRTMRVALADSGVSGGDKLGRITPMGGFMRRSRIDEIPQLWNVLRGDMSFVGPRPPLRQYVERFPQIYAQVLRSRPGITGLASLKVHRHEERILAQCGSPDETDRVYCRRCIPLKARIDLIYQDHASICLDLWILWKTLARVTGARH